MVEQSLSAADFEARVVRVFGPTMLTEARALAVELRGLDWLYRKEPEPSPMSESDQTLITPLRRLTLRELGRSFLRIPSSLTLVVGAGVAALTVLFPPHIVPLAQGFITNAGFAFILNPPEQGSLHAIVNAPLLALLVATEVFATLSVYFALRAVERSSNHARA
jgi:hypothetical protein